MPMRSELRVRIKPGRFEVGERARVGRERVVLDADLQARVHAEGQRVAPGRAVDLNAQDPHGEGPVV